MSIALSYLNDLGRVRITLASAPTLADHAWVERSTDQVNWTTVRAGLAVGISGGGAVLDDYEYEPGVINYYRASYVDAAEMTYAGVGTTVHADNAAVSPTIAVGLQSEGVLMNLVVLVRNPAMVVATPAGWTATLAFETIRVFERRWVTGDAGPTVTPTGGAAGDTVTAFIAGFQNAAPLATVFATKSNASAQNIATPAMLVPNAHSVLGFVAHKIAEVTTSTALSLFVNNTVSSTALGNDQAAIWQRGSASSNISSVAAQTLTITGGVAALSRAALWAYKQAPWIRQESDSITPENDRFWIKNLRRPNQNVQVNVTGFGDITRSARNVALDVVGRTMPIGITDLHSSRTMDLQVTAADIGMAGDLDTRFANGDVLLFQTMGPDCPIPSMYAIIGTYTQSRRSQRAVRRHFTLPLIEVAAPDPTVFSTTVVWQDIVDGFATWADLLAAEPTWSDVLSIVADVEVIVP